MTLIEIILLSVLFIVGVLTSNFILFYALAGYLLYRVLIKRYIPSMYFGP